MQNLLKESLKEIIISTLKLHLLDGREIYQLSNETSITHMDESRFDLLNFTGIQENSDNENYMQKQEDIDKSIQRQIHDFLIEGKEGFHNYFPVVGDRVQWENSIYDMIRYQMTDNNIYLCIIHSGEY